MRNSDGQSKLAVVDLRAISVDRRREIRRIKLIEGWSMILFTCSLAENTSAAADREATLSCNKPEHICLPDEGGGESRMSP